MKTAEKTIPTAGDIFKKTEKAENLSPILKALEEAHEVIKNATGAPRATIVVTRGAKGKLAHWTNYESWKAEGQGFNEILFSAEFFHRGAESVLEVLLHEVAHSLNFKNGEDGCSSEQYHNKKFAKRAEELGLKAEKMGRFGLAKTTLTDEAKTRWAEPLRIIEEALRITALAENKGKNKGRNKNLKVAICPNCGEKIRLSQKTFENCKPICGECMVDFKLQGAEEDGEE